MLTPTPVPTHPAQVTLFNLSNATSRTESGAGCHSRLSSLPAGKGKKAGKKKASGKAKGSTPAAPAASKHSTGKASKPTDAAACSALTVHALADKVLELYPDMDGAGAELSLYLLLSSTAWNLASSTDLVPTPVQEMQAGLCLLNVHGLTLLMICCGSCRLKKT